MPTNNGKPWNAHSQELEHERAPGPETIRKNSAAAAVRDPSARVYQLPSKARASELGVLDLREPRRRATDRPGDPERPSQLLGYALLLVTFVLAAVLLFGVRPWA